ncbi:MAG: glycosyltransferase family 39 protein [Planctomycetota bacterium]
MITISRAMEILLLTLLLSVFLALSTRNLRYDYAHSDEVVFGSQAVDLIESSIKNYRCTKVWVPMAGKNVPINNITDYNYALPSLMLLPVFYILGISVWSLKMLPILLAIMSVAMLYYVIKRIFGQPLAFITILLSVTSPIYIYYNRTGLLNREAMIVSFFIASILFYLIYEKKKNNIYLYMAALLLGSIASIKIAAMAYYTGLAVAAAVIYKKPWKMFSIKQLIGILLFFSIGSSLFIYYNISTKGSAFYPIISYTSGKKAVLPAIKDRIHHFSALIKEKEPGMERIAFSVQSSRLSLLLFLLFWSAFICNWLYYLFLCSNNTERKTFYFINMLYGCVFVCSFFSPATIGPNHIIIMFPFPQVVVALFIRNIYELKIIGKYKVLSTALKYSAVAILLGATVFKSVLIAKYQSIYALEKNGYSTVDVRNVGLLNYIREHNLFPVRFIDTDTDEIAYFISKGEMPVYNRALPRTPPREEVEAWMQNILLEKYPQYFVYTYKLSIYTCDDGDQKMQFIKEYLQKQGKRLELYDTIKDAKGRALYSIFEAK